MTEFKILGISHIGIAPKDHAKALNFFEAHLNLPHLGTEVVKAQKTQTDMFSCQNNSAETSHSQLPRLEFLKSLDSEGPIAKFLQTKGGGVHHIAVQVDNIEAAIASMLAKGIELIDASAREGAHATKIAFIHPRSTGGILVELVEETSPNLFDSHIK